MIVPRFLPRLGLALLLSLTAACSGPQLLNAVTVARDVNQAANLVYDPASGLRLDIYSAEGAVNAPMVVFFPGGRWADARKQDYEFVGTALAARGFVAVIPDLRQYPQVRFPAFMQDAANAVKWTAQNALAYGGDARRLFVMGHSSGAHIAALLALDPGYLKEAGVEREALKGMIGLAGAYDFLPLTAPDLRDLFGPPEAFEKSQPIYYVDGRNPPLLLIHGENDETVSVKNTRSLAHAVKSANGPVETVIYVELSHAMAVATLAPRLQRRADVMESVVDFIQRTVNDKAPSSGVAGSAMESPPEPQEAQNLLPAPGFEPEQEPAEPLALPLN